MTARTLPAARWPLIVGLAMAVLSSAACNDADRTNPDPDTTTDTVAADDRPWTPELAEELRAMGVVDQEVRAGFGPESVADTAYMGRMARADSAHSRRLRDLVQDHGWPRSSEVGPEAAEAAFLIVQHTPFEDWQRGMLRHVEQAVRAGGLDGQDYALLYDRVQMKLGGAQKYGTQLRPEEGRLHLEPIEDPAAVDSLRAELGMPPLDEYLEVVEEAYGMEVVR